MYSWFKIWLSGGAGGLGLLYPARSADPIMFPQITNQFGSDDISSSGVDLRDHLRGRTADGTLT